MKLLLQLTLLAVLQTVASASGADELGRLFFTAQQRALLAQGQLPDADTHTLSQELMINGIVQKHGGQRTVWIDGAAQAAGKSDEQSPASLPVTVPGQAKPIKLKVGQRVLLRPSANPDTTNPDTAKQRAPDED